MARIHTPPQDWDDRVGLLFVKLLRFFADTFFARRYGHRAVVLETVAAVPGMVGGMLHASENAASYQGRQRLGA